MAPRAIVRDPEILGGRWRFEGTSIPIAAIRADYLASRDELRQTYEFAGLTDEDIEAALTFEFPDIRGVEVLMEYAAITVNCSCGEDTPHSATWPLNETVTCLCGRKWRITVTPVHADSPGSGAVNDLTGNHADI